MSTKATLAHHDSEDGIIHMPGSKHSTAAHAKGVLDVQARAVEVFEDPVRAMQWMLAETPLLGGLRPIDPAATEAGKERVLTLLLRVERGVGV